MSLVARSAEIGAPLDVERAARVLAYLDRILEINRALNLTSIRDREDAVVRHVLDSLSVVQVWHGLAGPQPPGRFLDLGTGGGFPGAVLAAAWPQSRGLLIDGTGKKVRAVADALGVAGIGNAEALQCRGADLPKLRPAARQTFDLCVARAVGESAVLLRELAPLVARGGLVLLMKGPAPPAEELAAAAREAARSGLTPLPAATTRIPGLEPRTVLPWR